MYRNKLKAKIDVPADVNGPPSPFLLGSGSFQEGGMTVSKEGFTFEKEQTNPVVYANKFVDPIDTLDDDICFDSPNTSRSSSSINVSMIGTNNNLGSNNNINHIGEPTTTTTSSTSSSSSSSSSNSLTHFNDQPSVQPQRTLLNEVKLEDLQLIGIVGKGSSGAVYEALHVPSNNVLALKVIPLDVTDKIRKQILLELRTLYEAKCPYIVHFYGAFFNEGSISIALEYMDGGSLASLAEAVNRNNNGGIPELILAKLAEQLLHGMVYLHKDRHVIHRDIKPSNMLINKQGQVKITDFGVSGHLATSISSCVSWVGTITYMSPERIRGHSYSVMSDIWSFGLSMMELALGQYPFPLQGSNPKQQQQQYQQQQHQQQQQQQQQHQQFDLEAAGSVKFFDLLYYIVEQPSPLLPSNLFSPEFINFCSSCLEKDPTLRPTAQQLLNSAFIKKYQSVNVDLGSWLREILANNQM